MNICSYLGVSGHPCLSVRRLDLLTDCSCSGLLQLVCNCNLNKLREVGSLTIPPPNLKKIMIQIRINTKDSYWCVHWKSYYRQTRKNVYKRNVDNISGPLMKDLLKSEWSCSIACISIICNMIYYYWHCSIK